ncbi:hypothetical protein EDB86DRAFT_1848022 [Lactarius hatsudake]|nr:hypothetical protein EDB86DRAFT_1848022 [Lactarius hatsudake]
MPGYPENISDPEQGEFVSLDLGGEAWSGTQGRSYPNSGAGGTGIPSSEGPFHAESCKERRDFDDARFLSLADDMDGILLFAGLFSAVLASFLVQSIQNLKVDPAKQSVYYQQQSVYYQQQSAALLAQISQQIVSVALQASVSSTPQQVPVPSTSPPPYPAFKPSFSDIRVNIYWLISLVCSLSAALLAILVQQERDSDSFFSRAPKECGSWRKQSPG